MKIRMASDLQSDSIVDGDGIRTVIWTQGCSHNCKGCHNPETHDFKGGFLVDTNDVKKELLKFKGQDGITLSGGDPLFQAEACTEICKYAKEIGLNVWCYTGFTFEELLKQKEALKLLEYVDVLVDGKFVLSKKSLNVIFRGSTNQRILDVKKSLLEQKAIPLEKYDNQDIFEKKKLKEDFIFI